MALQKVPIRKVNDRIRKGKWYVCYRVPGDAMLDTDCDIDERPQIAVGHSQSARSGSPETYFTCKFCQRLFRKPYNLMIHERSHDTAKYSADIYKLRTELQACNRRDIRVLLAKAVREESFQVLKA